MQDKDRAVVRAWRNTPQISQYFFSQTPISIAEHEAWFKKKQKEPQCYLKIFENKQQAVGFLQLSCTQHHLNNYEWGFYLAPEYKGQGLGKRLMQYGLEYAFDTLTAAKVIAKVIDGNKVSQALHHALGFKQEGILRNECLVNEVRRDVFYYGLLQQEWTSI